MSAPRRLNDQQVAFVKDIAARRRVAMAAVRAIPTNAELAEQLNVSKRLIERVSIGGYADSSTGNKIDPVTAAIWELSP